MTLFSREHILKGDNTLTSILNDQPKVHCLLHLHRLNHRQRLLGVLDVDAVEFLLQLADLFRLNQDVRCLTSSGSRRLVNHDSGVGKGMSHS